MAGRKKAEDKRESVTIRLNSEEKEYIQANGTGTTFAGKLKSCVFVINIKHIVALQDEAESILHKCKDFNEENIKKVFEGTKYHFDGHKVVYEDKPLIYISLRENGIGKDRSIDLRDWV